MSDLVKKVSTVITDDAGNLSSTRIVKCSITAMVMLMWCLMCYTKGDMIPIPDSCLVIVLGSMGIGTIQKGFAENKTIKEDQ